VKTVVYTIIVFELCYKIYIDAFFYFQTLHNKVTRKPRKNTSGEDSSGETTDNLDDIDPLPKQPVSRRLSDVSWVYNHYTPPYKVVVGVGMGWVFRNHPV